MHTIRSHSYDLLSLAAQWRMLGMAAVAFARQILRMETSDPRQALQKAERLEMWAFTAIAALSQQLASTDAQSPAHREADAQARSHLQAITTALLMLALFAQRLKRRLAASQRKTFEQCPAIENVCTAQNALGFGAAVPFNDSG